MREQIQGLYILTKQIFNLIIPKSMPINKKATCENKHGVQPNTILL